MKYFLAIFAILVSVYAHAQFSLSGEFRPRTEFSHGYKTLAAENQNLSTITTQRTRLNAGFKNEWLLTKIVLQDVRLWGSQAQLTGNEDYAVSIHEAWARVFFTKDFSLQAGRQELVYDDHRIFGNVGWAQQGRSHDVALFKLENVIKLHLGIAHHENGNPTDNFYNGPDAYKDLQFLWFSKTWEKSSLSLLALNNGIPVMEYGEQKTKYSQTLGGHFSSGFESISLAANLYYQTGNHISGKDISALNALLELTFPFGITAGYEYLSGNSYNKNDKVYAFTPFYGTNHKFNGFMDYFYVGNHINSVGLHDANLKYKYSKNNFGFNAGLHYFAAAGKISDDAGKYLGTELDLTFLFKVHDAATISAGWSTMFAGDNMEFVKGGSKDAGNHWAYIMLSVNPSFIK